MEQTKRGRGRPPLPPEQKRKRAVVYFTREQHAAIARAGKALGISEFGPSVVALTEEALRLRPELLQEPAVDTATDTSTDDIEPPAPRLAA
jgi:hypothetical protein